MIDELTQWARKMYAFLRGRVRLGGLKIPEQFAGMFPRIISGANPGGVGHNWVKADFIDIAEPLALTRVKKEDGGMLRQYVPAKLKDNPTLVQNDPNYEDRLSGLGSEALVKAMKDGDWNIVAGGALDDVWSERIIIPRFQVPYSWSLDRSFDWGSARPFSVCWWAEADGTEATMSNGVRWAPPPGSLIMCAEWYGAKAPNEGVKMSATDVAIGIREREAELLERDWIVRHPNPGPADNQIKNVANPDTPTIADDMAGEGVNWEDSDKSPGSRRIGLELVRSRIREAAKPMPEKPGLFIMAHCRQAIVQLPVLPRDERNPEDVDTASEDHIYDSVRYRVLAAKQGTWAFGSV
jgi:hypothetical protein